MSKTLMSVSAVALLAGGASAQLISFTYSDLTGSYSTGTTTYMATAGASTSGDVSRLDASPGTAEFDTGTFPHASADFMISMSVSSITGTSAAGNGTVVINDANGDSITANVDGTFNLVGGAIFYSGILSNAFFGDESSDGSFDGVSSGSFVNPVPAGPYDGSIVELFFNPGSFFSADFSNQTTLVDGLLIPAPGALALLGLGGFAARRRR